MRKTVLKKHLLFCSILFVAIFAQAQEVSINTDSLRLPKNNLPATIGNPFLKREAKINISTTHPAFGKDGLQANRFNDFSINPYLVPRTQVSNLQFHGAANDAIFSKSRTAIASYAPLPRLVMFSGATLGLVETPFFGKGNYYILNAGANYLISPQLNAGISGMYNSDFGVLPFWNVSADLQYLVSRNLMLESSVGYMQTAPNMFQLKQSAVLVDLHARQRLTDDWYLNAYGGFPVAQSSSRSGAPIMPALNNTYYGGTVEYWFQPTVGAEAGLIWVRDMFSGKMRAQPKLELKFRPGR